MVKGYRSKADASKDFTAEQLSLTGSVKGLHFEDVSGILEIKENNLKQFEAAKDKAIAAALEEIGLRAERHAKRECPVDTGRLRNSITHQVMTESNCVLIGSNVEYAEIVEQDDSKSHKEGTNAHFLRNAATKYTDEYVRALKSKLSV